MKTSKELKSLFIELVQIDLSNAGKSNQCIINMYIKFWAEKLPFNKKPLNYWENLFNKTSNIKLTN